jgi:hypothetical protein
MSEERPEPISDDPAAPFGYDDQGNPIAPYGHTADGRPKRSPAGRRPEPGSRRSKRAAGARSPSRKPKASASSRKAAQGADYAQGLQDMMVGPTVALTIAGMKRPELLADAATLELHLPPIADALGKLAAERPEVAAMLDRLMSAGPYTALLSATVPLVLQLGANHGLLKGGMLGTMPPEALIMEMPRDITPEQLDAMMANMGAQAPPEPPAASDAA